MNDNYFEKFNFHLKIMLFVLCLTAFFIVLKHFLD